jgi:phosphoribosylformylglycinamidine cyclo-ligase
VFGWLARTGGVAEREMLRTFNCGIGMVVVVASEAAEAVVGALTGAGEAPVRLGRITARGPEPVTFEGRLAL